jgi:hypothetical protein
MSMVPQVELDLRLRHRCTRFRQLAHDYPKENEGMRSDIELITPGLIGNALRRPAIAFAAVVTGVAGLVLLLGCINLAGLLLASVSDRRKEIAVRLSKGAGRARLAPTIDRKPIARSQRCDRSLASRVRTQSCLEAVASTYRRTH